MDLLYLNAMDIEKLELSNEEILGAVEQSLKAQGNQQTVIEPRVHLIPNPEFNERECPAAQKFLRAPRHCRGPAGTGRSVCGAPALRCLYAETFEAAVSAGS